MNLGPGGKSKPIMRDTVWTDKEGVENPQKMVFVKDDPSFKHIRTGNAIKDEKIELECVGRPKGLRVVLLERGLWDEYERLNKECANKKKLLARCSVCSGKAAREDQRAARQALLASCMGTVWYDEFADELAPMEEDLVPASVQPEASSVEQTQSLDPRRAHNCCWQNIMRYQPDFLGEKPLIVVRGHHSEAGSSSALPTQVPLRT
jgi:hypothetical protein